VPDHDEPTYRLTECATRWSDSGQLTERGTPRTRAGLPSARGPVPVVRLSSLTPVSGRV
jgi:hypothetical protein